MKKCLLFLSFAAAAWSAPKPPNIIFILVDDMGWGDVGVFHQNSRKASADRSLPFQSTPNLDRMAGEGARLNHHYVGAPVCVSSRSSLLQGVTQGHANVRDNQFDKAIDANHTMASVLRQAGYATAVIGKWGLQGAEAKAPDWPAHPLNRGFDYFYGYPRHIDGHEHYPKEGVYFAQKAKERGPVIVWENRTDATAPLDKCYTTDLWTARAKKWITEQAEAKTAKPFFMYLAYDTPHAVLELPTQPYPAGGGLRGGMQWLGTPGHAITTASGTPDSWVHPDYANATYDDDKNPATPEKPWPNVYRRYATDVRRIDDAVGDLLQLLKDLKIDDSTMLVFASDNGPSIESYLPAEITPEFFASFGPFDGIKRDCWEGGMRTPAIARWPSQIPSGQSIDTPSAMWDWLPTFAQAAGMAAPARADGISLLPMLTGKGQAQARDYLYFEYFGPGKTPAFSVFEQSHRNRQRAQMQALRFGDLVAVRYNISSANDDFEIYDVVKDPKETRNLAQNPAYAGQQAQLKQRALQARRPEPETPRPYDNELVPASEQADRRAGLRFRSFDGNFPWVPNFAGYTPTESGEAATLDLNALKQRNEGGTEFAGYIKVPADGEYTFALTTDSGALVRLHEATVIDADAGYQAGTQKTAKIRLQAGDHPIHIIYRTTKGRKPALSLQWSGPGLTRTELVPASAFTHDVK